MIPLDDLCGILTFAMLNPILNFKVFFFLLIVPLSLTFLLLLIFFFRLLNLTLFSLYPFLNSFLMTLIATSSVSSSSYLQ